MLLQQFVNTDDKKLTKWYGFCDHFKSSYGTLFSALFADFVRSNCVSLNQNSEKNHSYAVLFKR